MSKLLTIYIPSYNRGTLLIKQLSTIAKSGFKDKIIVQVSDNSSSDPNYKEVNLFCRDNGFIYTKNKFNDRGNPNIFNGFLKSFDSQYLWILSDDDLIRKEAIDKVFDILIKNTLDVLILSHHDFESLSISEYNQEKLLKEQILISNGLGLISNVIYKSSFIEKNIYIGYDFIFSWFPHLAVLIKSFQDKSVNVGVINKKKFFEDELFILKDKLAYGRSYFGFVFLAELFEPKLKTIFIRNFAKFWNLRHWFFFKKSPNILFNEVLAYGYISRYSFSFKVKIFIWRIIFSLPFLIKMKRKIEK